MGAGGGRRPRAKPARPPTTAAASAAAPPPSTEKKLCVVCEDGPADYALLMCGHAASASTAAKHRAGRRPRLPLCRQPIERTMRIHDC